MRRLALSTVTVIALGFASPVWGQSQSADPAPVVCEPYAAFTAECRREFEDWQEKEKKWREYLRRYGNYAMIRSGDNRILLKFPPRPTPPVWLGPYCQQLKSGMADMLDELCVVYYDYVDYDWILHVEGPAPKIEHSTKVPVGLTIEGGSFIDFLLKNLHFDGLWTNSNSGSRVYGYFGAHLTFARVGRVYIWGPLGFITMRDRDDSIKVKKTWGIDFYLGQIPFPFVSGRQSLYLTLAKIFDRGESMNLVKNPRSGEDMIGFSITFKR